MEEKKQLKLTKKQAQTFKYLSDNIDRMILFGGGAGGAKTYLGCLYIILYALKYKETRWVIGRKIIDNLKKTTMKSFVKVAKDLGLKNGLHYKYSESTNYVKFYNGSEVLLIGLLEKPSDTDFDNLGSLELTGGFVDEVAEIPKRAIITLFGRIGRHLNKEYNIARKLLMSCNPTQNWIYKDFYIPWKEGNKTNKLLPDNNVFIQALYSDNPYLPRGYVEYLLNMKKYDEKMYYRYIGNWDYSDDVGKLYDYKELINMFKRIGKKGNKYMIIDIAGEGKDKTVIGLWNGLDLYKIITEAKTNQKELKHKIDRLRKHENIDKSNILVDKDGIGQGIYDFMDREIVPFQGGSSPIIEDDIENEVYNLKPNFQNLRAQCYYKIKEFLINEELGISAGNEYQDEIIEELNIMTQTNFGKDEEKIKIIKKDEIKEAIGRSPDFGDMIMMRMYFELKKQEYIGLI